MLIDDSCTMSHNNTSSHPIVAGHEILDTFFSKKKKKKERKKEKKRKKERKKKVFFSFY